MSRMSTIRLLPRSRALLCVMAFGLAVAPLACDGGKKAETKTETKTAETKTETKQAETKEADAKQKLAAQAAALPKLEQKLIASDAALVALEAEKDTAVNQLEQAELTSAEQSAKIAALSQQLGQVKLVQQQLTVTEEKLQTADAHLQKLQTKMEDVQTKMSYSGKNQLQLIRGIGPTYARRLNEFGIQTLADLAECDEDQVVKIIKKKYWQAVNISDWLDEAKALAASLNEDN